MNSTGCCAGVNYNYSAHETAKKCVIIKRLNGVCAAAAEAIS